VRLEQKEAAERAEREAERRLKEQEIELKSKELERTEQWRKDKLKSAEVQKELELRQLAQKAADEKERLESPVYKAKLFGEALRGTMARMPSDAIEILPWFRNVERLFVDFKVSDDLRYIF
jgi:hypothetical protein